MNNRSLLLSGGTMAKNRECILAVKVSAEFVLLLNELCGYLEACRSDVLRLAIADFVKVNMVDADTFAQTNQDLY